MSEKLLLAYLCSGFDNRVSEATHYEHWPHRIMDGVIRYTIPPKTQPHVLYDSEPYVKPEHQFGHGSAETHTFVSGDRRILMAYARELDTVYWRIED